MAENAEAQNCHFEALLRGLKIFLGLINSMLNKIDKVTLPLGSYYN